MSKHDAIALCGFYVWSLYRDAILLQSLCASFSLPRPSNIFATLFHVRRCLWPDPKSLFNPVAVAVHKSHQAYLIYFYTTAIMYGFGMLRLYAIILFHVRPDKWRQGSSCKQSADHKGRTPCHLSRQVGRQGRSDRQSANA